MKTLFFNPVHPFKLIFVLALYLSTFYNVQFFSNIFSTYTISLSSIAFFFSIYVILTAVIFFLFILLYSHKFFKGLIYILLFISALCAYFMNTFNLVIDYEMIRNVIQTNMDESLDLFSFKLCLYVLFLTLLPSYILHKIPFDHLPLKELIVQKFFVLFTTLLLILVILVTFSQHYSSFFREHKILRYYANPTSWIYAMSKYLNKTYNQKKLTLKKIGLDAKINSQNKPNLVILVVGEALRANRLSLNGYNKPTTPKLEKEKLINFQNFTSCGTSTAHSVPCMFSVYDKNNYSFNKANSTYNVLDILQHTKEVDILWRDNNSSSKGVANRILYEEFKGNGTNTICDAECRDEGMIIGLNNFIQKSSKKNILIVLHQMGNHGPAYYKRYPKAFEKFTPACKSNQLEQCTKEEISNAYDNATLYTDYFLSKVIHFLKPYSKEFNTTMLYMSDHGESLGENGIYLHGMPYFFAPKEQTQIPAFA